MTSGYKFFFCFLVFVAFSGSFFGPTVACANTLSCSVTTAAACTGGTNTIIYRMSGATNAHAELASQSTAAYANKVVCCSGVTGLGNSCSGTFDTALKLSSVTNSHAQKNSQSGYTNNACISVPAGGAVSVGYVTDPTTCTGAGYDTTLGTIATDTNSHVGDTTAYTRKICATATPPNTLICSVTTAAACTGGTNTVIYRMSGATNAHAELASQATAAYASNVVCCSGITGLGNSCSGTFDTALKLSSVTNAHSQENSQSGYANNACMSAPPGSTVSIGYVTGPTTCVGGGYDATLGSIAGITNSHVGNGSAYNIKICAKVTVSTGLPISKSLVSSVFDTTSTSASVGYNSIMWKGALGGAGFNEGKVSFQLAAASAPTGPWNFLGGATCGALDWFDTTGPDAPVELKGQSCVSAWNNKRYYKYKIQICSNDCVTAGTNTPTVNDVIVNWSP